MATTTGTYYSHAPDGTAQKVETLKSGDTLMTRDHGAVAIRWVGKRKLGADELSQNPKLTPIIIKAGALGDAMPNHDLPNHDLMVSPQHNMLIKSPIAKRMFGEDEVLIPAQSLLDLDGVIRANISEVTYYHILFDAHEIIEVNGAPSESLYSDLALMQSQDHAQIDEMLELFPEVRDIGTKPKPARLLTKTSTGAVLVKRHMLANQALI